MEDNTNIWNKRMDELTVKDVIVINVVLPIALIGSAVGANAVAKAGSNAKSKFKQFRANRKNNQEQE